MSYRSHQAKRARRRNEAKARGPRPPRVLVVVDDEHGRVDLPMARALRGGK